LDGVDFETAGRRIRTMPHTIWQIAHHMHHWARLKVDLIEGRSILMPADNFYPEKSSPPAPDTWEVFKGNFKGMLIRMVNLVETIDLETRYPAWDNQTAFELIFSLIRHNFYHMAQIIFLRRLLGAWNEAD
jgi:uncharacterized damage-inducible protein DinB